MSMNEIHRFSELKRKGVKDWDSLTLADHAEMWYYERGGVNLPARGTKEWEVIYQDWIDFSFPYIEMHEPKGQ
jgi:hypothetical protein